MAREIIGQLQSVEDLGHPRAWRSRCRGSCHATDPPVYMCSYRLRQMPRGQNDELRMGSHAIHRKAVTKAMKLALAYSCLSCLMSVVDHSTSLTRLAELCSSCIPCHSPSNMGGPSTCPTSGGRCWSPVTSAGEERRVAGRFPICMSDMLNRSCMIGAL